MDARYRRGAPGVREAFSEAFGVKKTGVSGTEGIFGTKTPSYGTGCSPSFQKSAAPETALWCTERSSEVFCDRNTLVHGMKRSDAVIVWLALVLGCVQEVCRIFPLTQIRSPSRSPLGMGVPAATPPGGINEKSSLSQRGFTVS